jgi:signal transduction histidine kinase/CheY-like chemotaxis protein
MSAAPPDPRIDELIEVLLALARQDFSQRARISDRLDDVDALAAGLNMLAEELNGAVASKRELEAAYSALKDAQSKLLHNGKLIAIGQMASSVAHEINNPASWVAVSLDVLSQRVTEARALLGDPALDAGAMRQRLGRTIDQMDQLVGQASEGMERIRGVAGDLRIFSRADGDAFEAVPLNEVVEAACRFAAPSFRGSARVRLQLDPAGPVVDGSRGRLAQVVTNLLLNAAQAVGQQGARGDDVTVRTRIDGSVALLVVDDAGPGVPPELLGRIFEPFFTTKAPELGTGLGLSLVSDIVNRHRGSVHVSTADAGGARFEVRLPLCLTTPDRATVQPALPERNDGARPRVLIVDDEVRLLRSYELLLQSTHDVVTSSGGEAAWKILEGDRQFDVVLCDLQMPDMNGIQLFEKATGLAPELAERFLFSTGGGIQPNIREFIATTRLPVLEKPIRVEALLERLRTMTLRRLRAPVASRG